MIYLTICCVFAEENKPIWMQAEEINVSYYYPIAEMCLAVSF